MKYKCRICNKFLSKSKFYSSNYRGRKSVQSACIRCKHLDDKKRRDECIAFFNSEKEKTPCVDCGGYFPGCVMDYHHIKNKKYEVSKLIRGSRSSKETILKEIAKCIVICANCHRIRTQKLNKNL